MAESTIERIIREQATLPTIATAPRYRKPDLLKESLIDDYAQAAHSSPEDWWHGVHFLNSLAGTYGKKRQRKAIADLQLIRALLQNTAKITPELFRVLTVIVQFAYENDEVLREALGSAYDTVLTHLSGIDRKVLLKNLVRLKAKRLGRKHGKKFTLYATRGGMMGERVFLRKPKARKAWMAGNSLILTIGTLWRYLIETRGKSRNFIDPYFLVLSGDWSHGVDTRTVFHLLEAVKALDPPTDDRLDHTFMRELETVTKLVNEVFQESRRSVR